MAGLGRTTAELASLRKKLRRGSNGADDAGLVEVHGFGFNPGALRMLAHVPKGLPGKAPLVVVLHGCTQRAGSHARAAGWITLADREGFAVLAPEQLAENNPNRCFNWFEPGDAARGGGEAASIQAMVEHMLGAHDLDAERVFVTGLSAGGAMTAVMLATYPETYRGGAVVAGLPYGVAGNTQEAFAAMRGGRRLDAQQLGALVRRAAPEPERLPRLSIWHGSADATVAHANAHELARQWAATHGLAAEPTEVRARHSRTRSVWRDANNEALIELNLLAGLGHGTPLACGGEDPIGEAAPFMLEAGVSSSLEIARFWGLAAPDELAGWTACDPVGERARASAPALDLHDGIMASVTPHVSEEVRRVIANALASAGLKRRA